MAAITGSSIDSLMVISPTYGTFNFLPMSDADNSFVQGGIQNDDNSNVAGGGVLVATKKRVPGEFTFGAVADDPENSKDYQFVNQLSSEIGEQTWRIILLNGTVWECSGLVQGELKLDPMKASFSFKVVCGQGWKQL